MSWDSRPSSAVVHARVAGTGNGSEETGHRQDRNRFRGHAPTRDFRDVMHDAGLPDAPLLLQLSFIFRV